MVCLIAPVTNNSDVQDSQKLGSVCFKRGLGRGGWIYLVHSVVENVEVCGAGAFGGFWIRGRISWGTVGNQTAVDRSRTISLPVTIERQFSS
eukprot:1176976-Prorocentrum_minimum.AAC.1